MSFSHISLKWQFFGVITYLLLTVTGSIVMMGVWTTNYAAPGMDIEQLTLMAETHPFVVFWSAVIGIGSALITGAMLTAKATSKSYAPALMFAVLLMMYGALSNYLHPEHSLFQQVGKIIVPVPVCLFAAWIVHRIRGARRVTAAANT